RSLHSPRSPRQVRAARAYSSGACACAIALALGVAAPPARADAALDDTTGIVLELTGALAPPPIGQRADDRPVFVRADELRGRPDLEVEAVGNAELRRADVRVYADKLHYDAENDTARAVGNVRVSHEGNVFTGPEAQLRLSRFEGFVVSPRFEIAATGATGTAQRVDILDADRAVATMATYTSCPADGSGDPAWLLSADRVHLDFEANEGVAEGAVLRFLGVPILGGPRISFPLSDARKSGWLPPIMALDSSSGFVAAVPYYWNIAPNRDATITPIMRTSRGPGVDGEFRYLEPTFEGQVRVALLPDDRETNSKRYALNFQHLQSIESEWNLQVRSLRVSDNDYWKDFPSALPSLTRRLLTTDALLQREFANLTAGGDWNVYAGVQAWQALQGSTPSDLMEVPYQRLPQIGVRTSQTLPGGFAANLETELNQFTDPGGVVDATRPTGLRLHAIGDLTWPYATPGWMLTPKLAFNAATYSLDEPMPDGRKTASRIIPTASLESTWIFERDTGFLGRNVVQTIEPRVLYAYTPYVDQSNFPVFDSAPKDFNFESIYTENAFSGIDRVSDGNQLTFGVTSRVLDASSGAEALRLALVQRVRFADQRVTPDGEVQARRLSDLLAYGSTTLIPNLSLDASIQYDPDVQELSRLIVGARYTPAPFHTLNLAYRQTPDKTEQVQVGWQWPIYGPTPAQRAQAGSSSGTPSSGHSCGGSLYTVGRINYNINDSRITDAVLGLEYDAGCWIGRIVVDRLSTGFSEATTRLMIQLELVGLSRLGPSPLQLLKDNITGYQLLRDRRSTATNMPFYD
ncbi:MAG TPA: LPS assembly protein LptD, partial [Burkholderiaceae bacterium]|nr:LPS assembly protein LptD [Burkholderiaceae bacterium]